MVRWRLPAGLLAALVVAASGLAVVQPAGASGSRSRHSTARTTRSAARRSNQYARPADATTASPIKHLVVIFQENVSFDHYFGTYPHATNPSGEPAFHARPGTPTVNGLSGTLLTDNPNEDNPQRLDRSQALTCDQNHGYTAEQKAFDMGLMDKFVQNTDVESCSPPDKTAPGLVMDYYDGNTVTGLWNYAQHYAMNDNSYSDTFGPSTPGALNVTSGNTYGAICGPSSAVYGSTPCTNTPGTGGDTPGTSTTQGSGTVYSDSDPNYDVCSATQDGKTAAQTIQMGGQNIGDLLDSHGVTWGWFQGGFASPGYVSGNPGSDTLSQVCTGTHTNVGGGSSKDYSPHHEPFQYYSSTSNPTHLPPTSVSAVGYQDQANHQYDLRDFFAAAAKGNLPAVSYLKAAEYQDGHAGYSDPLDEQTWLVDTINHLEKLPTWRSTAVVIAYDDSDGWYDHQMGPIINQSQTPEDALTGTGYCGTNTAKVPDGQQARCGVGPRQPLLVISPYAKSNYVDATFTTQSSVVKFIEDNWLGGQRIGGGSNDAVTGTLNNMFDFSRQSQGEDQQLILDPSTGEPASGERNSESSSGRAARRR